MHLAELELAPYDRDYAPAAERAAAWAEHLAAWPRVVDAAIESLDQVSAPVAQALLGPTRGWPPGSATGPRRASGRADVDEAVLQAALAAHARLVAHLERAAAAGDPDRGAGRRRRSAR